MSPTWARTQIASGTAADLAHPAAWTPISLAPDRSGPGDCLLPDALPHQMLGHSLQF